MSPKIPVVSCLLKRDLKERACGASVEAGYARQRSNSENTTKSKTVPSFPVN